MTIYTFPIVLGQFASLREHRLIWPAPFTRIHMFIGTEYNSDDVLIHYKVFRLEGDYGKVGGGGVSEFTASSIIKT